MDSAKIANNEAEYGAGLNNTGDGDIHLSNVTIVQNEATNSGGGIDSHGKNLLIEKSTITGNTADRAGEILIKMFESWKAKSRLMPPIAPLH